jgi:hypothetical protein
MIGFTTLVVSLIGILKLWKNIVELEEALAICIDNGCSIEYKGWHVYRDSQGLFILLHFDNKSELEKEKEENFDVLSDAVGKFVLRSRL